MQPIKLKEINMSYKHETEKLRSNYELNVYMLSTK